MELPATYTLKLVSPERPHCDPAKCKDAGFKHSKVQMYPKIYVLLLLILPKSFTLPLDAPELLVPEP